MIVVPLYALHEQLCDERIIISKVATTLNLADYLSKSRDVNALLKLLMPRVTLPDEESYSSPPSSNPSSNSSSKSRHPMTLRDRNTLRAPSKLNL